MLLYPIDAPDDSSPFSPVSSEEIAFALTLFVNAANRLISLPCRPHPSGDSSPDVPCARLFLMLCGDRGDVLVESGARIEAEASLYEAFHILFAQYDRHPQQESICARVLAFHFFMERSAGAALAEWVRPDPETPQYVELHPAVVEAIASVRLDRSSYLSESSFLDLIRLKSKSLPTWSKSV